MTTEMIGFLPKRNGHLSNYVFDDGNFGGSRFQTGESNPEMETKGKVQSGKNRILRGQQFYQSFTTIPAPITSEPLFTVPATSGTCNKEESSS